MELVLVFPVTLLIVLAIVQFGVWYHAADIARAAAQQGVKAASAYRNHAADGEMQAARVIADNGRSLIHHARIAPYRDREVARVTVTGSALTVIPLIHLAITETATAPVEALRPPGGP